MKKKTTTTKTSQSRSSKKAVKPATRVSVSAAAAKKAAPKKAAAKASGAKTANKTASKPAGKLALKAPVKAPVRAAVQTPDAGDIINLILRDHLPLKQLIEVLKDPELDRAAKETELEDFAVLLTSHAKAEEQTLYVEMKEYKDLRVESFEGDTEHAIADQLVQEINATPDDDEWNAKVKVLAEMVEHHIEEEEGDMLPQVRDSIEADIRIAIGERYVELKAQLDQLTLQSSTRESKGFETRLN